MIRSAKARRQGLARDHGDQPGTEFTYEVVQDVQRDGGGGLWLGHLSGGCHHALPPSSASVAVVVLVVLTESLLYAASSSSRVAPHSPGDRAQLFLGRRETRCREGNGRDLASSGNVSGRRRAARELCLSLRLTLRVSLSGQVFSSGCALYTQNQGPSRQAMAERRNVASRTRNGDDPQEADAANDYHEGPVFTPVVSLDPVAGRPMLPRHGG